LKDGFNQPFFLKRDLWNGLNIGWKWVEWCWMTLEQKWYKYIRGIVYGWECWRVHIGLNCLNDGQTV
jgi:hypothetical protein